MSGLLISPDGKFQLLPFDKDTLRPLLNVYIKKDELSSVCKNSYTFFYANHDEAENVVASKFLYPVKDFILGPVFVTGATTSAGNQRPLTTGQVKSLTQFAQLKNPFFEASHTDAVLSTSSPTSTRPPPLNLDEDYSDTYSETGLTTSPIFVSSTCDSPTPPPKRLCTRTFIFQMLEDDPFPQHASAEVLKDGTLVIE